MRFWRIVSNTQRRFLTLNERDTEGNPLCLFLFVSELMTVTYIKAEYSLLYKNRFFNFVIEKEIVMNQDKEEVQKEILRIQRNIRLRRENAFMEKWINRMYWIIPLTALLMFGPHFI